METDIKDRKVNKNEFLEEFHKRPPRQLVRVPGGGYSTVRGAEQLRPYHPLVSSVPPWDRERQLVCRSASTSRDGRVGKGC